MNKLSGKQQMGTIAGMRFPGRDEICTYGSLDERRVATQRLP